MMANHRRQHRNTTTMKQNSTTRKWTSLRSSPSLMNVVMFLLLAAVVFSSFLRLREPPATANSNRQTITTSPLRGRGESAEHQREPNDHRAQEEYEYKQQQPQQLSQQDSILRIPGGTGNTNGSNDVATMPSTTDAAASSSSSSSSGDGGGNSNGGAAADRDTEKASISAAIPEGVGKGGSSSMTKPPPPLPQQQLEPAVAPIQSSETIPIIHTSSRGSHADNSIVTIPRYIFGWSTGHAGSTTTHEYLKKRTLCTQLRLKGNFELTVEGERTVRLVSNNNHTTNSTAATSNKEDECAYTRDTLLPFLEDQRMNRTMKKSDNINNDQRPWTWIDIGHFHNRGNILECFARLLGAEVVFVRIRRNRYDVAYSFARSTRPGKEFSEDAAFTTPCHFAHDTNVTLHRQQPKKPRKPIRRPKLTICPHSEERQYDNIRPIQLPVSDEVWVNQMSPTQRFFWYHDEMEARWHAIRREFDHDDEEKIPISNGGSPSTRRSVGRPRFLEIDWTTSEDLQRGLRQIQNALSDFGCHAAPKFGNRTLFNRKKHVKQPKGNNITIPLGKNMTYYLEQDALYRQLMKFTPEQEQMLFGQRKAVSEII